MKMRLGLGMMLAALLVPGLADAQRRSVRFTAQADDDEEEEPTPQVVEDTQPGPLRTRFGADRAEALMRTSDSEQVRQGIVRAAIAGTPEAVALIVAQAEASGNDDLTLIDLARALGPFASQEGPRKQLIQMLTATVHPGRTRVTAAPTNTAMSTARVELARQIAARALVASHDPLALDAVFAAARESGSGQQNALRALASDPSAGAGAPLIAPTASAGVRATAQNGDLRSLDLLLAKAQGNVDASTRAASLVALAELGDGRARPIAIAAFADPDAHVRAAAGEALVLLDAAERFRAVVQLLGSDDTAAAGIRLAHRAQDGEVVKALASRFAAVSDPKARLDIIAALGRGVATDDGLKVLSGVAADPRLGGDAVHSIARSPNAAAMKWLERIGQQASPVVRRLAVRGYVLRAALRGERSSDLDGAIDRMRASADSSDRALAAFARVALGRASAEGLLDDGDAAVRRAAAMGSLATFNGLTLSAASALLARYTRETDDATRAVLAIGLLGGDPQAQVPTLALVQRIEAGGADALLSATALAGRKGDLVKDKVEALLGATDPVMRAHVARGLGASEEPSATGRLAEAARYEAEPLVRLAEITALAQRSTAPVRSEMLRIVARFDPEARIRDVASRALAGATPPAPWPVREVAWLRIASADGRGPSEPMLGSYVTAEGIAIPVAFDADGYALVLGVPPGDGRLILAPVLPRK